MQTKAAHKKILVAFPPNGDPATLYQLLQGVESEFGKQYQPGAGQMYLAQMQGQNWLRLTAINTYELTELGRQMRESAVEGKKRLQRPRSTSTQQH